VAELYLYLTLIVAGGVVSLSNLKVTVGGVVSFNIFKDDFVDKAPLVAFILTGWSFWQE
jgi:hypothetical protein